MAKLAEAFKAGYRPFTVADLLAVTDAVAEDETKLQKRYKELSEDYDALAARYNGWRPSMPRLPYDLSKRSMSGRL